MTWWWIATFLAGMLVGAGLDMLLVRYVIKPRYVIPGEPHRIEGTEIMLEPDPQHHGNHCA